MKKETIRLIIRKSRDHQFLGEWRVKKSIQQIPGHGKPTSENLSKWRDKFNSSLSKGGANEHLGLLAWLQCKIEIYNQFTGEIVCTYNPPMFEVIN